MDSLHDRWRDYPQALRAALTKFDLTCDRLYLAGGTVRDWLLHRECSDLDLVVAADAQNCCRRLMRELGPAAFVPLGEPANDTVRLVWNRITIDVCGFRGGATTIEEDLTKRDFSINAMAVAVQDLAKDACRVELVDPMGGLEDLKNGVLRLCPGAIADDPLRMLRGYRFQSTLGFAFDASVREAVSASAALISRPAAERIRYELDLIMGSNLAGKAFAGMVDTGILWHIIPELQEGLGLVQPDFHHLDVFHHSLEALCCMERIISRPKAFFADSDATFSAYISREKVQLKWAALFHDLGKPATMKQSPDDASRRTFYDHDRVGRDIFYTIAERLRWSREARKTVGRLIELHMYPFHLCNAFRSSKPGKRTCLRIWKKAGADLPGVFLLAMADSLACRGIKKPDGMESELKALFLIVQRTIERSIQPVVSQPRLVTGRDLIDRFQLTPGPLFKKILEKLESARVEGKIADREEALDWIAKYLQNRGMREDET